MFAGGELIGFGAFWTEDVAQFWSSAGRLVENSEEATEAAASLFDSTGGGSIVASFPLPCWIVSIGDRLDSMAKKAR